MVINTRIWVIAGVLLMVVVLALGGLLGVKPQLDILKANNDQRSGAETLNLQHRAELTRLREQSKQTESIAAEVAELQRLIPSAANLDDFINEIATLQVAHGVRVVAYSSLDEALFAPTEQALATLPASISANNFVTISIQLTVEGPRANTMAFVEGLQKGPRLFLASDLSVTPTDTIDIKGLVYRLLDTPLMEPAPAAEASVTSE